MKWEYHFIYVFSVELFTPYNVYTERYLEIIQRRKEVKSKTLEARRDDNRSARKQGHGL
jgi:hypothetical protein